MSEMKVPIIRMASLRADWKTMDYVAAARATLNLVLGVGGDGGFRRRLEL